MKRYRIVPTRPIANDALTLQLDIDDCIVVEPQLVAFVRSGQRLRIDIGVTDICNAQLPARTQHYDLGSLPSGNYLVTYRLCSGNPPPQIDPCFDDASETLTIVARPASPVRVPAISLLGLICLCSVIALTFLRRTTAGR